MADIDEESLWTANHSERSPLIYSPERFESVSTLKDNEPILVKSSDRTDESALPETSTLGRKIGWSSAYILVISRVIGSGIFAMPGVIVQDVGSPGLALLLWLVGALVAWAGLVIAIEYGAMLPRSGGIKVYLEYTYPWPRFLASTMIAVQTILLGFTASNCIIFAKYMMYAVNFAPTDLATKTIAVGLLAAITIVHGCFYRAGIYVQNLLGWVKMALSAFMILTGFAVLFQDRQTTIPSSKDMWKDSNWSWDILSAAFFKVLYSFAGLENINNVMNEVKHPVRTVKTVGPAALLTACIVYVLINIAYLAVVPLDEVKQSRELIAALFFQRLGLGHIFLPVAIALSAAGNVMVVTFSLVRVFMAALMKANHPQQARLNQEVARQGFLPFPHVFASSRPFGSPMGGLVVHFVPSFLVIVLPSSTSVYAFIAETEVYASQFFGLATAVGLVVLRYRKKDLCRPFKAWLPAVLLRIVLGACLILAPLFPYENGLIQVRLPPTYAVVGISV